MTNRILNQLLCAAKRLAVAGVIAAMTITSVAGCAKKEEEDFKFSGSVGEEKREDNTTNPDTTPNDTEDENTEKPDNDSKPNTDKEDNDTDKPSADSDKKDDTEDTGKDPETPTDDTDTKPGDDNGTTDPEKPGEDAEQPDKDEPSVEEPTVVVIPDITAVAAMDEEQATTALEGLPFTTLRTQWSLYQGIYDADARYGIFTLDSLILRIYHDEADLIVSVTMEVEQTEDEETGDEIEEE